MDPHKENKYKEFMKKYLNMSPEEKFKQMSEALNGKHIPSDFEIGVHLALQACNKTFNKEEKN